MLDHPHRRAHPRHHPRRAASLTDVQRPDRGRWSALLPVHRGQGGALRRQEFAPDFPGAGRPGCQRVLSERHLHLAALRCAIGSRPQHSGSGERAHQPSGLRHRVRLFRPTRPARVTGNQGDPRSVPCRPDQRHHRLRGSRRSGPDRRPQRRTRFAGRSAMDAASRPGLYRRADRRPDPQRHAGAVSHVYLARRVPAAAARGQRRPAPDRNRSRVGPGGRCPLGRVQRATRSHRHRRCTIGLTQRRAGQCAGDSTAIHARHHAEPRSQRPRPAASSRARLRQADAGRRHRSRRCRRGRGAAGRDRQQVRRLS